MRGASNFVKALPPVTQNKLRRKPLVAALLLPFAIGAVASQSAAAAVLPVANCNDSGSGSLRDTVAGARSGDTVDLRSLACNSISLVGSELSVTQDDLVLQGPGSANLTIQGLQTQLNTYNPAIIHHGAGTLRIDSLRITDSGNSTSCIESNGTVSLNESVVTGCRGTGVSAQGLTMRNSTVSKNGYIGVVSAGDTTITGSTISDNGGGFAGGVSIASGPGGTVRIENTTISGNKAHSGYYVFAHAAGFIFASSVTITNSTVAFNSADSGAPLSDVGALLISSPQVTLESTIFANNSNIDLVVNAGTVIGGHNNLLMLGATVSGSAANALLPADTIKADPKLLPLADNGGSTMTHALGAGSPAIDAGNNNAGLASDQRGAVYARVFGTRADIGAFEVQSPLPITIGPGFTGTWYDPTQSGHGIFVEVLDGNLFAAYWFAFTPDGTQQSWFGGVGNYSGATATIAHVNQPGGGRWIPNFNPANVVLQPWGGFAFTFSDCNHGRVDFNSGLGYGAGHMDLTRLTKPAGLSCP